MKMKCPVCGADADLIVAAVVEDDQFSAKANDFKLTCGCGLDIEGEFSLIQKCIVTIVFLAPVAGLWAAFLLYGQGIAPAWVRFIVFMLHLIPGFLLGIWLSTRYGKYVISKMTRRTRPLP